MAEQPIDETNAYRRAAKLVLYERDVWQERSNDYAEGSATRAAMYAVVSHFNRMLTLLAGLVLEAEDPAAIPCAECGGRFVRRVHNQKRCQLCRKGDYYDSALIRRVQESKAA